MTIGELTYKITGDSSGLRKELNTTDKNVVKAAKNVNFLANAVKAAFSIAVLRGVVNFGKRIVGLASEAEETANKFGVVFDTVIDEANEFASVLANSYGLAQTESKALLANTGDLLVGFGVAKDTALELSFEVQKLAVDLASFTNFAGGASGASEALTKALLGETESAKSLGLVLGEAPLKEFAENQGLVFKELGRNEKMFLRLQLATSQSGSAIGDFNRSVDSFANQMRIARARTRDLAEEQGNNLLPLATLAVKTYNQFITSLKGASQAISEFISSAEGIALISDTIGTLVGVLAALKEILDIVSPAFRELIDTVLIQAEESLAELTETIGGNASAFSFLGVIIQTFVSVLKVFGTVAASQIDLFVTFTRTLIGTGKSLAALFQGLKTGNFSDFNRQVKSTSDAIIGLGTGAVDNAKRIANSVGDVIGNFSEGSEQAARRTQKAFENASKTASDSVRRTLEAKNAQDDLNASIAETSEETEKAGKAGEKAKTSFEKFQDAIKTTSQIANAVLGSLSSGLSAYGDLQQAQFDAQIDRLDQQLQAELEARGLAEETAIESFQRERDEAIAAGDAEAQAEAEKNIERAKIEEDYQKQKAKLEYEAALANYEIQKALATIQLFQAPLNAYVSALQIPLVGPFIAPALAAAAFGTAALQFQAVEAAKPVPPKFATGGIVPGSSFAGDNVNANVNSGEMILNERQQGRLFKIADGQTQSNQTRSANIPTIEDLLQYLYQAMIDGRLPVPSGALV